MLYDGCYLAPGPIWAASARGGHEEGLTGVWLGPGMHLWVSCS